MLIQPQSQGYFCLYVSPQQCPLKTSATDFTWRQRFNEHGSMHFNVMPHFIWIRHFVPKKTSGIEP